VWECETWRGAVLAECCCVATAMGEWCQAVENSWEGDGEEGGRGRGKGRGTDCDVIVQLTGGPLRSVTMGFLYYTIQYSTSLLCSVRLSAVYPRYPTCCPVTLQAKPTSLYVLPTRCPARCPSGVRTAVIPLSHQRARCCSTLVPSSCARLVRNQIVFWCTAKPMLLCVQ
jgi:hypothetical protein